MKVEHCCATCKHRKDFLVPCDWLKSQNHVILKCTRYEKENPWVSINNKLDELCKVEQMPTVAAVEVVHGRWENVKETEVYSPDHRCTFTHTAKTCSSCNVRIGFIGANFYLYDAYCPNCGAKMDGDGNA